MRAKPIVTTSKSPFSPKTRTRKLTESSKSVSSVTTPFIPRTPLGIRLMALREKIRETGAPLLSWEEIDQEIFERRGESR